MAERSQTGIFAQQLSNGLRVIVEPLTEFSSVSVGVWVLTGSRDETSGQSGISHLIEHLVFKGTPTRNAKQIALEIDSLGGTLNAFTGKEFTTFYARVLGEVLPDAMGILGDIILNSHFDSKDLEKERDVVIQEISMVEDTPDDLIHDLHSRKFWSDHSLGWPILGTQNTLLEMGQNDILSYHHSKYRAGNIVITAAGNIQPETLMSQVERTFSALSEGPVQQTRPKPYSTPDVYVVNRPIEQVHFCAGFEGLSAVDDRRYSMFLLNTILGGGMSSRLFQKIREEHGLAYSVYSYHSTYQDIGLHSIYCGTSPDTFSKAMKIIKEEIEKLADENISEDELSRVKRQLKGHLLLGLESTGNRMNQLARNEIYFGRHITHQEIEEKIEAVTLGEIKELANDLFDMSRMGVTVIGPITEEEVRDTLG